MVKSFNIDLNIHYKSHPFQEVESVTVVSIVSQHLKIKGCELGKQTWATATRNSAFLIRLIFSSNGGFKESPRFRDFFSHSHTPHRAIRSTDDLGIFHVNDGGSGNFKKSISSWYII